MRHGEKLKLEKSCQLGSCGLDDQSFNSIQDSTQDYLYSALYDTIVAKQLYRELSF